MMGNEKFHTWGFKAGGDIPNIPWGAKNTLGRGVCLKKKKIPTLGLSHLKPLFLNPGEAWSKMCCQKENSWLILNGLWGQILVPTEKSDLN